MADFLNLQGKLEPTALTNHFNSTWSIEIKFTGNSHSD